MYAPFALNGAKGQVKRALTLRMIEGLHEAFSIPAESPLTHGSGRNSHAA